MDKHPSYTRLISKLFTCSGKKTVAAAVRWLALNGYEIGQQRLNNWSRRGVPDSECLHIGRIIKCDPVWLFYGQENYDIGGESHANKAADPIPLRIKPLRQTRMEEIATLLDRTDDFGIVAMLEKAKEIANGYPLHLPKTDLSSQ